MMIDTPQGVAFAKACARAGALDLEIKGMHRSSGQTAYSIVKQVYGFRGKREAVLADLNEYIEAELRLRKLPEDEYKKVLAETQRLIELLDANGELSQLNFEHLIGVAEGDRRITHEFRQSLSDLFYVTIVRQNAGYR